MGRITKDVISEMVHECHNRAAQANLLKRVLWTQAETGQMVFPDKESRAEFLKGIAATIESLENSLRKAGAVFDRLSVIYEEEIKQ